MDAIKVTPEFQEEASGSFESFANDLIETGIAIFEDDPRRLAEDSIADELRELQELAGRWNVVLPDLDDLIDALDDIEHRGESTWQPSNGGPPDSSGEQQTLF